MNTANKISLNRIIGDVIGNLGLKVTNNIKDDFSRWACEAENKIGSTSSYRHYECELTIRNRKASLPPNFMYLEGLKSGNKIINLTDRSFRLFSKGFKNSDVQKPSNLIGGQKVTNIPGVALVVDVKLAGAFITGDVITVTVTANNCGSVNSNTFNYIVQAGDSLTIIAANISTQINAIGNIGYTSAPGNDLFQVIGDDPTISFQVSLFTDSVSGSLTQCVNQKRVPPRQNTVNLNNTNKNPILQSNNLANASVAELNTGLQSNGGSGTYGMNINSAGYDYGDLYASVFSIDNGCINFNALDDTKIGISYMGVELDEDGWPLISETHEDAVTSYIMYMHMAIGFYKGKTPLYVYEKLERRWFDLCGQARGDDELPNNEEMKYLANMWMQLVPLPSLENF
tara:strand:+ start:11964 stop:13160 length:1197 start_codon:yes stop_codon:yes gene_type:complete